MQKDMWLSRGNSNLLAARLTACSRSLDAKLPEAHAGLVWPRMSRMAARPQTFAACMLGVRAPIQPRRPEARNPGSACPVLDVPAFHPIRSPRQRQQSAVPAGEQVAISVLASN
jgi:hypothetical protein